MSFDIDIVKVLGAREVRLALQSEARVIALLGPSGIGKTSILNMIAGVLRPDRGRIAVGGEILFDSATGVDRPPHLRGAGYVYQDVRLFPHLRVGHNLAYGAHGETDLAKRDAIVALLGIGDLLDRRPATLSGGEAQRVAIGRALLSMPRFLLMDEPLASVDVRRREEILNLIQQLRDELTLPILYVTHDRAEAERLADRIVDLTPLDGEPPFAPSLGKLASPCAPEAASPDEGPTADPLEQARREIADLQFALESCRAHLAAAQGSADPNAFQPCSLEGFPYLARGHAVTMGSDSGNAIFLADGWWPAEEWGVWGRDARHLIRFALGDGYAGGYVSLVLTMHSLALPAMEAPTVAVIANGHFIGRATLGGLPRRHSFALSPSALGAGNVVIQLEHDRPTSPSSEGLGIDGRVLGVALTALEWR